MPEPEEAKPPRGGWAADTFISDFWPPGRDAEPMHSCALKPSSLGLFMAAARRNAHKRGQISAAFKDNGRRGREPAQRPEPSAPRSAAEWPPGRPTAPSTQPSPSFLIKAWRWLSKSRQRQKEPWCPGRWEAVDGATPSHKSPQTQARGQLEQHQALPAGGGRPLEPNFPG